MAARSGGGGRGNWARHASRASCAVVVARQDAHRSSNSAAAPDAHRRTFIASAILPSVRWPPVSGKPLDGDARGNGGTLVAQARSATPRADPRPWRDSGSAGSRISPGRSARVATFDAWPRDPVAVDEGTRLVTPVALRAHSSRSRQGAHRSSNKPLHRTPTAALSCRVLSSFACGCRR